MKKILCLLLALLLLFATLFSFASCFEAVGNDQTEKPIAEPQDPDPDNGSITIEPTQSAEQILAEWQSTYTAGMFGIHNKNNPFVEFTLSNGDTIRLELYTNVAPISVDNFIKYVEAGFYEGTVFHRSLKGMMIQGGGFEQRNNKILHKDPLYDEITGEFARNGIRNDLKHTSGVISMARTNVYDSATSQFFICTGVVSGWNNNYAAFGKVIDEESMAAVKKINDIKTESTNLYYGTYAVPADDVPTEMISITKATVVKIG